LSIFQVLIYNANGFARTPSSSVWHRFFMTIGTGTVRDESVLIY
jgi:hypothetical protein